MLEKCSDISPKTDLCVAFGSLRSGTTMLRLILDGHSRFVCPGEADFLVDHLITAPDGECRYDLDALAADRIFQTSGVRVPETDAAEPAFASMVDDLRAKSEGCLILVLHRKLDRLLKLEPQIPILHILRDPRDVARSAIGMGWAGNVYYGAKTWLKTEKEWEQVAPGLHFDQCLEFHYEGLVRTPEDVLRKICMFLEYDYDPEMLSYPDRSTYSRPDPSLTEQWRRKQSARELGLIEPLFGDLLTKRGYKPSGHPPISPGLFERFLLRTEHSYSVWRRRIARYGLFDPLLVRVAGKLGAPQLVRSAQKRMDVTTQKHLK